jgi:NAD(P)-dependent dehydrogenase (short-subunit alcohol dehydrogenase family)
MGSFSGRRGAALVTGGSGALGAATVRALAREGSTVAFTYRGNLAAAEVLLEELGALGATASAWPLDLGDPEAAARLLSQARERFGGIHTVVYASGPYVPMQLMRSISPTRMREQLDADAAGFYNLAHPAIAHLRESKGTLVAISSTAVARVIVRDALSSVPKGAVDAMVKLIAVEEGRFGVRANSVGVGMTGDGMAARLIESGDIDARALEVITSRIPLRRFGTARDVAEAVCFLASDRARFITGQTLRVDGGYSS